MWVDPFSRWYKVQSRRTIGEAENGDQRQLHGVPQQCDTPLGGGAAYRLALYRAWQAHAERVHRELQWALV